MSGLIARLVTRGDDLKSIGQAISFVPLGKPIRIEIATDDTQFSSAFVELIFGQDPLHPPFDLVTGAFNLETRTLPITFYNATSGTSGTKWPILILVNETVELFIAFHIELLNESTYGKLTYELFIRPKSSQ